MGYNKAASIFIALLVSLLHPLFTPVHTPLPLKVKTAANLNALEVINCPWYRSQ
jgi:hypothetical protein